MNIWRNLIFSLYTEHTFIMFMKLLKKGLLRGLSGNGLAAKPDALSSIHETHTVGDYVDPESCLHTSIHTLL